MNMNGHQKVGYFLPYTLPSSSRFKHQWEIELGRSLEQEGWELAVDG